jgi:hypothetical protein
MNATERDQLQQFLSALRQQRADPKDPTADGLIREAVSAQADAPYLLVQRAMGLGMALEASQQRLQQLEAQCAQQQSQLAQYQNAALSPASQAAAQNTWLSGAQAWGRGPAAPALSNPASPALAPRPGAAAFQNSARAPTSAWGGGMMTQLATTAAGVVAGGLLFQGVQSLMGLNQPSPAASPESNFGQSPADASTDLAAAEPADDASWDSGGEDWA